MELGQIFVNKIEELEMYEDINWIWLEVKR